MLKIKRSITHDLKWSKYQEKRSSVGIQKKSEEIVLDFDEDDKDEDGELDLVQKLDNLDSIIYFIKKIIQPFQMLDWDSQQI